MPDQRPYQVKESLAFQREASRLFGTLRAWDDACDYARDYLPRDPSVGVPVGPAQYAFKFQGANGASWIVIYEVNHQFEEIEFVWIL